MTPDVNDLSRVQRLIAEASARIGSQNKLAAALGYDKANVSEWMNGKRSCPVQAQALMADMTGLDGTEVALHAMIQSERNPQRKEQLFRILGKGFRQLGGAALAALFAGALWAFNPAPAAAATSYDVYYVNSQLVSPVS
jgi:DNA-binding transcriptional regulator YdaS (Cro superfamily)